jgi:hypothetical protein
MAFKVGRKSSQYKIKFSPLLCRFESFLVVCYDVAMTKAKTNKSTPQTQKIDTLGIISIVLAFTALQIPGLIVGIVGEKNAKKEGRTYSLSRIGWVINLCFIVIAILGIGFFLVLIPSHVNSVDDMSTKANLNSISRRLEDFHEKNGHYPPTLNEPSLLVDMYKANTQTNYKVLPEGCDECSSYTLQGTLHKTESGTNIYTVKSEH